MVLAVHRRFLAWLLLAIAAWWPALATLVQTAVADDNYSYTLLVLGVAVVLLCLERWPRPSEAKHSRPSLLAMLALLAAFAWWNFHAPLRGGDLRLSLSVFFWIAFVSAAFVETYGRESFSRSSFPFFFSLLAVPLPTRVIEPLVVALQWASADATYILLRLFHVPVARDGLVFSFSNVDIEVAEECSSIRSSTILVVTTLVIAQLFLKAKLNKLLVVLIAIPISVLKNGVRIFILSLLAQYVSIRWLDSPLHRQGGFIFLSLGLAIMLAAIWLFFRAENRRSGIPQSGTNPPSASNTIRGKSASKS
jgi:exosortase